MKRLAPFSPVVLALALLVPTVSADVKTRDKSLFAFEGVLGGVVRIFGGRAAREGVETTTAVKGDRKLSMNSLSGRIVDLAEERTYELDVRRKEYTIMTFAQLRAQLEQARAEAKKQAQQASPEEKEQMQEAAKQLEFDVKVDETGQTKALAGHSTREVVLTITGREKGKTLEEGGGFVLTNNLWLASRVPALEESMQFELRAMKAIYGEEFFADMQQMASALVMYPALSEMGKRMQEETRKLQGTSLATTSVFEGVKSAAQMQAATDQRAASSSGGGLSGRLAGRLMGNRNQPQQRTKVLTITNEYLSIDTTVGAADVALPPGYKEKK